MIQTSHGLYRTVCCSFPRSGQSLLKPVLSDYFGDRFKYCEWYDEPEKRPNVCAETNFVKTHDRELNWHIRPDWKYLVLIRNPIDAVSSWRIMEREQNYNAGWKLSHWAKWFDRWVLQPISNRLIVSYESLVRDPRPTIASVIKFLDSESPDVSPNEQAIRDIILSRRVCPRVNHAQEWLGYL